jgi:hypothetical protein
VRAPPKYRLVVCQECGEERYIKTGYNPLRCRKCSAVIGARSPKPSMQKAYIAHCLHCGKPFDTNPSANGKCCSYQCANAHKTRYQLVQRVCLYCGKSFMHKPRPHSNSSGTYCCLKCRNMDYRHMWHGHRIIGRMEPRQEWNRIRRDYVRDLNGFCGICGHKGRLEVHHIIAYRVSQDNSSGNLVTLCHSHHMAFQKITDMMATWDIRDQQAFRSIMQAHLEDRWHILMGGKLWRS